MANPSLSAQTYAERLGFPPEKKVLILHVDDFGMSYESNQGTIKAIEQGVANSASMMMPCPWVPQAVRWVKAHPGVDVGIHLTLTSEWEDYRWGPLAGKPQVPGLVDPEGALWPSVEKVVQHATPEEIETEIRAQLSRAGEMGFEPTHLDSHMGTLFATPDYLMRYIKVGVEEGIPVMVPGGHNHLLRKQLKAEMVETLKAAGTYREGMDLPEPPALQQAGALGKQVWDSGLPVLDDLHNLSYGWEVSAKMGRKKLQRKKTDRYIESFQDLQPGLTMVIMHCIEGKKTFGRISDSGPTRYGDLLAMQNPYFQKFLKKEGIVLTTWRELMERRQKLKEK